MSTMTVGKRITLGFTLVILIAIALGGLGVWNMLTAKSNSTKLASEYVPEVKVATDLRGAVNRTMYQMRGYSMTEDDKYYTIANQEIATVETHLNEADDLAARAIYLKALKGQVTEAKSAADEYASLMKQTEATITKMKAERTQLDKNAASYMQNCAEFLAGQNTAFKNDLSERQKKVELVTDIVNVGTSARVMNFRAQATGDMALMQDATELLKSVEQYTAQLRPITRDAQDIERIDEIESATSQYAENMAAYINTDNQLEDSAKQMDENAAAYMENCNAFLISQNEAMQKDFSKAGANLKERLEKITLVNDVIDAGNATRVMNFKAQATDDQALMQGAIKQMQNVPEITKKLLGITRQTDNIQQINAINAAAEKYVDALNEYMANFSQLDVHRKEMDSSAGKLVSNCAAFLEKQQENLSTDMHERHEKISLLNDVIDLVNDARVNVFKAQALNSPALIEDALRNFPKMDVKYNDLKKITRLDADLKRIENTKGAGNNYAASLRTFLAAWIHLQELGGKREVAGQRLVDACKTTADAGMNATDTIANDAASSLGTSSTIMIIGLILGAIIGVIAAILITRSITGPLHKVISGLSSGSEQVTSASGQVSSSSQEMAEGASEQASSLEEISSSLEEMTSMTRQNADNAKQASGLMDDASSIVSKGMEATERMSAAVGEIKQSSDETAKIIKTIDEIAFQTNLLALNAAVEAARAGEAGKGFAVVAEEVRNLAQRSAEAAKNTADLIEGSQKNSDRGVAVTEEVAGALKQIVDSASKVGQLIGEVSAASNEQAQGIDQVNTAVAEMDKVVQQNAANAEESASASEELSSQALELNNMVGELQTIVGGSDTIDGQQHTYAAPPAHHQPTPTRKPILAAHKPAPMKHKASTAKPDEVIPLDDDDFSEF